MIILGDCLLLPGGGMSLVLLISQKDYERIKNIRALGLVRIRKTGSLTRSVKSRAGY